MADTIAFAEHIIKPWDPEGSDYARITSLFHENRDEAARFIRTVHDLHRYMLSFARSNPSSPVLLRAHELMNIAINRLKKEFYQILAANSDRLDSDSVVSSTRSSVSTRASDATIEEIDEIFDAASTAVLTDEEEEEENEIVDHDGVGLQAPAAPVDPTHRFPLPILASLRSIAKCMVSTGYSYECIEAYKRARSSVVQQGLARSGFDLSVSTVPVAAGGGDDGTVIQDRRLAAWVAAAPRLITTVFAGERLLANFVFGEDTNSDNYSHAGTAPTVPINESCFTLIARDAALRFLAFPERVAAEVLRETTGCKRRDRIFGLLDAYNALADLLPEISSIFSYQSTYDVQAQLVSSILKLREVVHAMLADVEHWIQNDASKAAVPGGGLHPLTEYVMDYVVRLTDEYSTALSEIFADHPFQPKPPAAHIFSTYNYNTSSSSSPSSSVPSSPHPETEEGNRYTPAASPRFPALPHYSSSNNVSAWLAWLLLVLLCKLDGKSKLYKNAALSYLFLANNLRYMVARVHGSKRLGNLLGREWTTSHEHKSRSFMRSFERLAWNNVAAAIPADAGTFLLETEGVPGTGQRMTQFNRAFEEAYKKQARWTVLDSEAREELRASLNASIAEPYRLFYDHCRPLLRRDRDSIGVVRFAPEDVAQYLADLYERENTDVLASPTSSDSGTSSPRSPAQGSFSHVGRCIFRTAIGKITGRRLRRPDAGA